MLVMPLFTPSGQARLKPVLSQDCQLCGAAAAGSLCPACLCELPVCSEVLCPQCAAAAPSGQTCGDCLAHPPQFDRTAAAFRYAFPLDRLLQSFKFNGNLSLAPLFAAALADAVQHRLPHPDIVVPLPLARKRLAERGYNQAALLAQAVAKTLHITYAAEGLLKVRDTPPQAGLDRAARIKNVRGAFECATPLSGRHIAVVDDVMTTGATLSAAAAALKKAGAASVSAWVLARADRAAPATTATNAPLGQEGTVPFDDPAPPGPGR